MSISRLETDRLILRKFESNDMEALYLLLKDKEFWNKGIVTEASKALIGQLSRDGIPFITATHDKNNPKSGSVMRKIGYTKNTGIFLIYTLSKRVYKFHLTERIPHCHSVRLGGFEFYAFIFIPFLKVKRVPIHVLQ